MFAAIIDKKDDNDVIIPDNDKNITEIQDEIDLLHYWKKFAKRYSILHAQSSYYYKVLNITIMFPIIILTIGGGFLNIIFADNDDPLIYILIGILQLVVAFFTGVYNFIRIPELQESHNLHYIHFLKLENNIKVQLLIGDTAYKEFTNLYVYVIYVKEELNRLIDSAPPIPENIINKYNKTVTDEDKFLEKKKEIIKTNRYIKKISYKPNLNSLSKINKNKENKINKETENKDIENNKNEILLQNEIINQTRNISDMVNISDSYITTPKYNNLDIDNIQRKDSDSSKELDISTRSREKYKINVEDTDLIKDLEKQKRQLRRSLNSIILNI